MILGPALEQVVLGMSPCKSCCESLKQPR